MPRLSAGRLLMATMTEQRRASLSGGLGDVAWARHSIGDWLRDWHLPGLVEDVELVASELITNAILHGGGAVEVVLERRGEGVRVAVRDGRPDVVPMRRGLPPAGGSADADLDRLARSVFDGTTTGRGLLLIDAFSDAWGVAVVDAAKVVWAELGTGRSPDDGGAGEIPAAVTVGVPVRVASVPARLVLLSASNLDDLVRELQTTSFDATAATELAALGERLVQATSAQREPLRAAARAALQRGARRVDVALDVPPGQVDVLARLVSLTDEVERFCRSGVLLSEAPTTEVTDFRRWYVDELDRQVHGHRPTPCPFED